MPDRRKLESGMLVLAVSGALLIVPPLVYLFNRPVSHFGVPQIVLYLFGWWILLVAGTALITYHLPKHSQNRDPAEGDD
jgi:hypothetical protein